MCWFSAVESLKNKKCSLSIQDFNDGDEDTFLFLETISGDYLLFLSSFVVQGRYLVVLLNAVVNLTKHLGKHHRSNSQVFKDSLLFLLLILAHIVSLPKFPISAGSTTPFSGSLTVLQEILFYNLTCMLPSIEVN